MEVLFNPTERKGVVQLVKYFFSLLIVILSSLNITAAPLPPLVPEGESLKDFPNWHIKNAYTSYRDVAFSPNGKMLVTAADNTLIILDISSRHIVKILEGHTGVINSIAFSPDGKIIATASNDKTVMLWDIADGKHIKTLRGHTAEVNSLAFSPDGNTIASASSDQTVKLWEYAKGKVIDTLEVHEAPVKDVIFSPNGKIIASISDDRNVSLWSIGGGALASILLETGDKIRSRHSVIAFHPDGNTLAIESGSGRISIWNIHDKTIVKVLTGHDSSLTDLVFSPDGNMLASSSSWDHTIKIWNVSNGNLVKSMGETEFWPDRLAFNSQGNMIAMSSWLSVELWDMSSGTRIDTLVGPTLLSDALAVSPSGKIIASQSSKSAIMLWDVSTGLPLYELDDSDSSGSVGSAEFNHQGNLLATVGSRGAKIWDVIDRKIIKEFKYDQYSTNSAVFSPDDNILAISSRDGVIDLWDVTTGALLKTLERNESGVNNIVFSEKNVLVGSSRDGTIKLWSLDDGSITKTLVGHTEEVSSLSISPHGGFLASASSDKSIKLWDISTGKLIRTLQGHSKRVVKVVFSPNGETLATASQDATIKLWRVSDGNLIKTIRVDDNEVENLAFTPSGKTFISASWGGVVKIWSLPSGIIERTIISGTKGGWLTYDNSGSLLRSDSRGDLLQIFDGNSFKYAIPKSWDIPPNDSLSIKVEENKSFNLGESQNLTVNIHNKSKQTLLWLRLELPEGSSFRLIGSPVIYKLASGEQQDVSIRLIPKLKQSTTQSFNNNERYYPQQNSDTTLTVRAVAPQQLSSSKTVPVIVNSPQIEMIKAEVINSAQGPLLSISLKNSGKHWVENTVLSVTVPEVSSLDSQIISKKISSGESIIRTFSLPMTTSINESTVIKANLRTTGLPFLIWNNLEQQVTLPAVQWWRYLAVVLLVLVLLAILFLLYYLHRLTHPLAMRLLYNPSELINLPIEQLNDADRRLKQAYRLQNVLSGAEVSTTTFQNAAQFTRYSPVDKAKQLTARLGAKLTAMDQALIRAPDMALVNMRLNDSFLLNLKEVLLCFPEGTAAEDVFILLRQNIEAQGRVVIIISNDSAYQRKLYNTTRDLSNKWVAPQGAEITQLLLSNEPDKVLAEIVSKQLSLQQISPYRIGGGVNASSMFFGRYELISQIVNRDPANYLMVGGRQVGKSSLLKAIERHYTDNAQVQCVYLTLSNEILVPRLASLLKLPKTNDVEALAEAIEDRVQTTSKHFLFLVDETDRFIEHETHHDYAVLNVFRRLSEQGHCTFIITGFWQLYRHAVLDYQSPIRNFGELLSVGELEKLACIELATQPMLTMNLSYANDSLVMHLVESCGQRANLIVIACQHIVRHLPAQQRVIEAGDVANAMHSDDMRRALSGWVVGHTETEQAYERMVVYSTIGLRSFDTGELLDLFEENGLVVDSQILDHTLARLELSFTFGYRKGGQWFYRVPLFVDYIKSDSPETKFKTELRRLSRTFANR